MKVVVSPAWYDEYVLTVGSVGPDGAPSQFSMAGPWVDMLRRVRESCRWIRTAKGWWTRCRPRWRNADLGNELRRTGGERNRGVGAIPFA